MESPKKSGSTAKGKRIAVIGSGITGLGAAWLLQRSGAQVTLFEKEAQCGGHTLTDTTSPYPVDLGFQVFNLTTYPNLVGFFVTLGVDTEPSDMSFSLSMDGGKLEWASHGLSTVFAQRKNLASPTFLRMIYDVVRFGREAPKVLEAAGQHLYRGMDMATYLKKHRYSQPFIRNYLLPMSAAVWSVPNSSVLAFPVQMLVRFWANHHLLDLTQRPMWRVVKGRGRTYVDKVLAALPDVRTSTPVASVRRRTAVPGTAADASLSLGSVTVTTEGGVAQVFDAVLFATHSDITLRMLGDDADADERRILAAVPYNENDVYLHTDASLMPLDRHAWASWNLIGRSGDSDATAVCVSYWVNNLQSLPSSAPDMFVTLNPITEPAADKVIRRLRMAHPVFSAASWQAQDLLPTVQGRRGAYYAGAWAGFGFHEDGLKAAIAAVQPLGVAVPWIPRSVSPKSSLSQQFYLALFDKFCSVAIRTGRLRFILPNGAELNYGTEEDEDMLCGQGQEWRGRPPLRATVRVHSYDMFRKVVLYHDTGLGEAFMEGMYDVDNLGSLMAVVTANATNVESSRGAMGVLNWLGDKVLYRAHRTRSNTVAGSRKNIEGHYDSGNAMYRLFLDETLTYSSGVHHEGDSLHQAQLNKIDAIIAKAKLCKEDHVLEIGCGWGGFAIRAAQTTGCRVTGLTLSKEQLAEAQTRVKAAGLEGLVKLLFCDYRDCPGAGTYDKVVSVEMIEAVGQEHLLTYFQAIGLMLKPGGLAVIQAISVPDERYEAYCGSSDFIRAHIFPGGHLPSMGAMVEAARGTGLSAHDVNDIGPDYAITLREWRRRWEVCEKDLLRLGYSTEYWRKFRFYFAYCEAGFDARFIHNFHITWCKDQPTTAAASSSGAAERDGGRPAAAPRTSSSSSSGKAAQASSSGRTAAEERYSLAGTGIISDPVEVPNDPVTQGLVVLYIYMTGMIVRNHAVMYFVLLFALLSVGANSLAHHAGLRLLPFYRRLNPELRAWWCADLVHLAFSTCVSLAAGAYVISTPRALHLSDAPPGYNVPAVICAAATGFFAFFLWVCVRNRLFARTGHAIVQYTVLLVLFGVATYKSVCLPFLCVTLVSELSSVFFLAGKLQHLAGVPASSLWSRLVIHLEVATLLVFRLALHSYVTVVVLASPGAFSSPLYYVMSALGMAYCNYMNAHRVLMVSVRPASAGAAVAAGAALAAVVGSAGK